MACRRVLLGVRRQTAVGSARCHGPRRTTACLIESEAKAKAKAQARAKSKVKVKVKVNHGHGHDHDAIVEKKMVVAV